MHRPYRYRRLHGPAQPSTITGNTSVCQGTSQSYSVTDVPGVTYTWAFPSGWTQTAGTTTSSIIVTVGSGSGNITVTPSISCGSGTARTLAVTSNVTPSVLTTTPGSRTGAGPGCIGRYSLFRNNLLVCCRDRRCGIRNRNIFYYS
ncbi:hypothetical protein [Flavobacterium sp. 3HN19-14]|uniref:hypothetical protein n=1 Tax=Flavobacterium sp. 3HN19-14 TaxID=3448133 RepID=UPI003EE41215